MKREPYTEPYTLRERLSIQVDLKRYDVRRFFEEGIWRRIAFKLPHKLALWAFIRVCGNAGTAPDDTTYPVAYEAWEARKGAKS